MLRDAFMEVWGFEPITSWLAGDSPSLRALSSFRG